jgi:hypothetical protein
MRARRLFYHGVHRVGLALGGVTRIDGRRLVRRRDGRTGELGGAGGVLGSVAEACGVGVPRPGGVARGGGHGVGARLGLGPRLAQRLLALRVRGEGRVEETNDDGLAAAVEVEVPHGVADGALVPESAEDALEIGEAVDGHGLVLRSAQGPTDEGRDRGGDAGDRPHAAGYLLYVYAGVGWCDGH